MAPGIGAPPLRHWYCKSEPEAVTEKVTLDPVMAVCDTGLAEIAGGAACPWLEIIKNRIIARFAFKILPSRHLA